MSNTPPMSGPYMRKNKSVQRSMLLVMLALSPATAFGFLAYGWPAILLFTVTLGSALVFEVLCLLVAGRTVRHFATDGSALVTAWLLAVSLPPWAPWWIGVLGSAVAIVIAKHAYGGLGQNVFNPAMVARVVLLISFPLEMTYFVRPAPPWDAAAPGFIESLGIFFGNAGFDATSSATVLNSIRTGLDQGTQLHALLDGHYAPLDWILGLHGGSMAEGSDILLLLGGVFLIANRVMRWHIPVSFLAALAVIATLFNLYDDTRHPDALVHLFSGTTMLAAFFIATDPVTSPMSPKGQIWFGIGLAALVYAIRTWAAYPEGMSFAILLMNALTPLIDRHMKPRIFGRNTRGESLNLVDRQ